MGKLFLTRFNTDSTFIKYSNFKTHSKNVSEKFRNLVLNFFKFYFNYHLFKKKKNMRTPIQDVYSVRRILNIIFV